MSIEIITAIFAGIVLVINAVGVIIVTLKNRKSALRNDGKLDEIHTLVNSRLTKALEEIEALRAYINKFTFHEVTPEEIIESAAKEPEVKVKVHGAAARKEIV